MRTVTAALKSGGDLSTGIEGMSFPAHRVSDLHGIDCAICALFGTIIVVERDDIVVELASLIAAIREHGAATAVAFMEAKLQAGYAYAVFLRDYAIFA